jgi:tetratricopeptide (TPR) repeat protein
MRALGLVMLVAAGSQRPAGLDAYMRSLAVAVDGWSQAVELAAQERADETEALLSTPPPAILQSDLAPDPKLPPPPRSPVPRRDPRRPNEWAVALGRVSLRQGFPEQAVPLFVEAAARGSGIGEWELPAVWHDLAAVGASSLADQWVSAHPKAAQGRSGVAEAGLSGSFARRAERASARARMRLALVLWNTPPGAGLPALRRLDLLASMLPPEGRRLAREAALRLPAITTAERARLLTEMARDATAADAFKAWTRLADARLSSGATGYALLQMASIREREGDLRGAVKLLERARDADPGTAPDAQWRLGLVLYAIGDVAAALDAFIRSETVLPRLACCGQDFSRDYAFWEGLCLERLGRIDEAVGHYVFMLLDTRVTAHVLDLYEAAGQFADVEGIFAGRMPDGVASDPSEKPALTPLALRRMARAADWPGLMGVVRDSTLRGPTPYSYWMRDPRESAAAEAARLLARDCDTTGALLVEALDGARPPWVIHALGLCGSKAAVSALDRIAASGAVRQALSLSEAGRAQLRALGLKVEVQGPTDLAAPPAFPKPAGTPLPKVPVVPDHTPRPYRGSGGVCVCE